MKVLIDRNIEINARTHKSVLAPQSVQWGDITVTAPVLQRASCTPRPDEHFRTEQLPYLATVCVKAKEGTIELYSSDELLMERVRQKGRDRGYIGFNLLEDVKIETLRSPVPRTIVFSGNSRDSIGLSEEEQKLTRIKFVKLYFKLPSLLDRKK